MVRYRKIQREELQCVGLCISIYTVFRRVSLNFKKPHHPYAVCKTTLLYKSLLAPYNKVVLQTAYGWCGIVKFNDKSSNVQACVFQYTQFFAGYRRTLPYRTIPRQSAKLLYYIKAYSPHIIKLFCRLPRDGAVS